MSPSPFQAAAGIPNACQALPNIVTAGQPSAAQLEALKNAGVSVILDIRDPMEPRPFDEAALVRKLGMEYVNIPVVAGRQTDAELDRITALLRASADKQVFFHCASANRVGAAIIPYLMSDAGMEEEDAVSEAMRIGMRSAELMEWGLSYGRKQSLG
jgi:protein tyrosine phosphatase (PTP) superfamily phosphohydrolase (DUF442 family)